MDTKSPDKNLHIPELSIKGFRGINDLTIPRLGRVTLLAGKNNSGKTSILEGIRLLAESAAPEAISEILQRREENSGGVSNNEVLPGSESFLVSALFSGFPHLTETTEPIVISSSAVSRKVQMHVEWFLESADENDNTQLVPAEDFGEEYGSIPALVVETDKARRVNPIDRVDMYASRRRLSYRNDSRRTTSRFVSSSSTERTELMGPLWDNISLTDGEQYVVEALQIIDPQISDVSMIGEQTAQRSRTAVVRSANFLRRVPLRSFGDGMNRLFGIILSLVNTSGGILLIDEFENGMHYTVQVDAWRMIFRLAEKLNVQVIATTHSWDCIVGFSQAATEAEEVEGVLYRIDRIDDRLRAVEYSEKNMQVAARQGIEVR